MKKTVTHMKVIPQIVMKTMLALLGVILCHYSLKAQMCMPLTNTDITVDGIVAGSALSGSGALPVGCSVDVAWQNVIGQPFAVFGAPGSTSAVPSMFISGYNASADATLDKIFIGVHVEGDPELDEFDRLVIYFHAGGTTTWDDAKDFALLYEVGDFMNPSTGDESCNNNFGTLQYYRHSGGTWIQQSGVPASIISKVSRDYNPANDGESEIWELEISINLAGMELSIPSSGTGFGIGAKLYVNQTIAGSSVWRWPTNLTNESNPSLYEPDEGNVTADKLMFIKLGNCADVAFDPDPTSGVTATDAEGNSNKFTRLNSSNFSGQTPLKQNHFTARIKLYNPSDLTDNSPLTSVNSGQINSNILPWNSGFLGTYLINNSTIEFTQLNQIQTVEFDWPETKNQYDDPATHQPMNDLSASHHTCLDVQLSGFNPNSNVANDRSWRNLTYITTSSVRDTFLIKGHDYVPSSGSKTLNYILRANWKNINQNASKSISPEINQSYSSGESLSNPSGKNFSSAIVSWDGKVKQHGRYQNWDFKITNGKELGLEYMGDGYYSFQLKPGEVKYIAVEIAGGLMPAKPSQYSLSADAGGTLLPNPSGKPPLLIDVQAGKMVTIIANGLIKVEPQKNLNSPNGFIDKTRYVSKFLLKSDCYDPSQNIGALIGSFNNFNTAFVIGSDITFLVPQGATKLYLAVNDIAGAYNDNTGKFEINMVMTEPLFLPTRIAAPENPKLGLPARPRVGSNLPELEFNAFQKIDNIGEKQVNQLVPTGYVAYGIYNSHPEFINSKFELVLPFIGYSNFSDSLGLKDGVVVGARLSYNFAKNISVELEGGNTFSDNNSGKSGNIIQALANLRYDIRSFQLGQKWATIYATGGVGKMFLRGFSTNSDYNVLQLGAGATLDIKSWLGLRIDTRYFSIGEVNTSQNCFQSTAGLVFWF